MDPQPTVCQSAKYALAEEMHLSEPWQQFAAYPDAASAEVVAGLLRLEGVAVNIASDEPVPGLIQGFRLMVPADMLHRAQWVVSTRSSAKRSWRFSQRLAWILVNRLAVTEHDPKWTTSS